MQALRFGATSKEKAPVELRPLLLALVGLGFTIVWGYKSASQSCKLIYLTNNV